MADSLKINYEVTLLVQSHREKTVSGLSSMTMPVIYDNSTPEYQKDNIHCVSRFQSIYLAWCKRNTANNQDVYRVKYDFLVAWDGCSPWCLSTARRLVKAEKSIIWLHDNPNLYMIPADLLFYRDVCSDFDAIIASDEEIKNVVDSIGKEAPWKQNCFVVNPPIDVSWYWERSKQPCAYEFREEELNLLAVCRMSRESALEQMPKWLSEHQGYSLPIHCYIAGDGERVYRYIQQIAIHLVDHMVTLMGNTENPYSYIRRCDALLVCEDERQPELEHVAQNFGVPVILFEELEQRLPELKKRNEPDKTPVSVWQDKDMVINILEGR